MGHPSINTQSDKTLLKIEDEHVHFTIREGFLVHRHASVKAVNAILFTLDRGDGFGLVGESGCGKTTLGRAGVGLAPVTAGNIYFNGRSIVGLYTEMRSADTHRSAPRLSIGPAMPGRQKPLPHRKA